MGYRYRPLPIALSGGGPAKLCPAAPPGTALPRSPPPSPAAQPTPHGSAGCPPPGRALTTPWPQLPWGEVEKETPIPSSRRLFPEQPARAAGALALTPLACRLERSAAPPAVDRFEPAYLALERSGELERRADTLWRGVRAGRPGSGARAGAPPGRG